MPSSVWSTTLLGQFDPEDKGISVLQNYSYNNPVLHSRGHESSVTPVGEPATSVITYWTFPVKFVVCADVLPWCDLLTKCHTGLYSYSWIQSKTWYPTNSNSPYNFFHAVFEQLVYHISNTCSSATNDLFE